MSGYINSLDSQAFNINDMREWFSRMLLIERKKAVPEFQAVRRAISNCYKAIDDRENLKDVIVDYDAEKEDIEIQMLYDNGNAEILPLHYLSDGSKSILAMVADIAYRMAILNPHLLGNVIQETTGIVLIDEIDMHLHPEWQRKIISALHETFPKVQFICTTHSPTVLTNIPRENIQILDNGKIYNPNVKTYGRDVNSILREVMKTEIRPSETSKKLSDFADAISNENLNLAEKILNELKEQLGENDAEVVGAQVTLDLEKI
jgi:predicted ATP-binding protein involved in virulence